MSAVGFRTVVEIVPSELSQKTADWYADEKCTRWVKYGPALLSNLITIALTPLMMLADLVAALVFKIMTICTQENRDYYNQKSWEFFKSGTVGGLLLISLAFLRIFCPGLSGAAPAQPIVNQDNQQQQSMMLPQILTESQTQSIQTENTRNEDIPATFDLENEVDL